MLDAFVAASFVGFIGAMLSADAVQRGRSLFAEREGDEIADAGVRARRRRHDCPTARASAPFDGEGSPTRRTPLIEGGRLLTFLFDARTARRAGRADHGQRQPRLVPLAAERGDHQPRARTRRRTARRSCSAQAGDGLFVTDVAGLHSGVNPVSGTFSVGASGRLIESGELGPPGA